MASILGELAALGQLGGQGGFVRRRRHRPIGRFGGFSIAGLGAPGMHPQGTPFTGDLSRFHLNFGQGQAMPAAGPLGTLPYGGGMGGFQQHGPGQARAGLEGGVAWGHRIWHDPALLRAWISSHGGDPDAVFASHPGIMATLGRRPVRRRHGGLVGMVGGYNTGMGGLGQY